MDSDGGLGAAGAAGDAGMGANPVGVSDGGCDACAAALSPPALLEAPKGPAPPAVAPAKPKVSPIITVPRNEVLVRKPYLPPASAIRTRVQLTDSDPGGFDGSGNLTVRTTGGARVDFYDAPAPGGTVVVSTAGSAPFSAAALNAGVTLYAEGLAPSAAVDDVILELALSPGLTRDVNPPVKATLTSIELFLEVHQSRTDPGIDPTPLSVPNKVTKGRVVHRQVGNSHGRAMVIVRKAVPNVWPNNMELRAFDTRVRLFDDTGEIPPTGGAVALPLAIPNGPLPPTGRRFWAEGVTVSGGLADTGFKLGIPGLSRDGDWVRMTVAEFSNLGATVPATAPLTTRANVPNAHVFTVASGRRFDEDFTRNRPLVLIENSVLDTQRVNLTVQIRPAGVPVFWKAQRAQVTASAAPLDHADVIALSANREPSVDPTGSDTLTPTLRADAVGSFHIHAYVDCNGTGDFERDTPAGVRIDREPYIVMNLVLAHIELDVDNSRTNPLNFTGVTDGANGIALNSGDFNIATPATNGIYMNARIIVVGGGPDGKLAVNRVFAGWVNNIPSIDVVGTFVDSSVPPPVNHRSRRVFVSNQAAGPFVPGGAAPAHRRLPLLDVGPAHAPEGTGGETATLTRSRIRARRDRTPDPGQFFLVESVDCPRLPEQGTHLGFPAAQLTHYRFRLNFRVALCVWTGTLGASAIAANRLYSVVQEYDWKMRADWNITPATGAVTLAGAASITISNVSTHTPADPVQGGDVEVRFPTALNSLTNDYTA
jgi:hypothetical protein